MARRLTPEARRAEIIDRTRRLIAEQGPTGLSIRSVARWCEISPTGLLHYFDGLTPLLETVIAARDEEELAAATGFVTSLGPKGRLIDLADALVRYSEAHPVETRHFDALEVEAVASPGHPAHDYYLNQINRPLPPAVELAQREYADPDAVIAVLGVIVDGLRHRWLRSPGIPDYWNDWEKIRDLVFSGFEQRR